MSEKYQINGPKEEVLGLHFQTITKSILMVGSKLKFKPFLDHIVFHTMKFSKADVLNEGVRQKHKYRYQFGLTEDQFRSKMYVVQERYTVKEINSIIKIT